MSKILSETLLTKTRKCYHFFRNIVDGGCGGVPMATVMDIEGEKVVLKVKRDPGYLPKYQLTNLEYSRKIQDFDECFKDSPNFENLENSNAVNFTRHCREEMDG